MERAYLNSEPMGSAERGGTVQGRGRSNYRLYFILFVDILLCSLRAASEPKRIFGVSRQFFLCFFRWRGFYDPGIISVISFISAGWVSSDTFATDATLGLGSLDGAGNPTERLELDLAYFCY